MTTTNATGGAVATVDPRASEAAAEVLRHGGGAVDAAIAANAVLTVTSPHLCGLGGDLFAIVAVPGAEPVALNASGRAGSGADAAALRRAGHAAMPLFDLAAVTVPGCVDGWTALHRRFGTVPLPRLLAPATAFAEDGFAPSAMLRAAAGRVADRPGAGDLAAAVTGETVRRPGIAATLRAIGDEGRDGLYRGAFGAGLLALADGLFAPSDLDIDNAEWVAPLARSAFGHTIWTTPPNSQGYVALAALAIAEAIGVPEDTEDPAWAHVMIEASRLAGVDRPNVLHEDADVMALLADTEIARRAARFDPDRRIDLADRTAAGGTTYLCVVDADGVGVSLIQSNAAGFGSGFFEPSTGIGLHNRGLGFSLVEGHPAEYRPGRRPPHTLMPMAVTRTDGTLRTVVGTMGGDTQPQIMTQVLTRLLRNAASPAAAIDAPRWRIGNVTGFDTWTDHAAPIELEHACPAAWDGLTRRGHHVARVDALFGHAQIVDVDPAGAPMPAADPRGGTPSAISVSGRP